MNRKCLRDNIPWDMKLKASKIRVTKVINHVVKKHVMECEAYNDRELVSLINDHHAVMIAEGATEEELEIRKKNIESDVGAWICAVDQDVR